MLISALSFFDLDLKGIKREQAKEYDLKAACLYRLLFFVEWPVGTYHGPNAPIIIGIIGKDPYGEILNKIKKKKVLEKGEIHIKLFEQETPVETLKACHLLFISSSLEKKNSRSKIKKLIDSLKKFPVLTVSEIKGFGHLGGMINFVIEKGSVKFEINKAAADYAGLKISSKVLSLAIDVIGADHAK
jgi:hypothetical protein